MKNADALCMRKSGRPCCHKPTTCVCAHADPTAPAYWFCTNGPLAIYR
jgi:hypothetical protein